MLPLICLFFLVFLIMFIAIIVRWRRLFRRRTESQEGRQEFNRATGVLLADALYRLFRG